MENSKPKTSLMQGVGLFALLVGDLAVLIGQANIEIQMLTKLDDDSAFLWRIVVWLIGTSSLALLSWGIARWILVWLDETFPNPAKLFNQLCTLHSLNTTDRQLLKNFATYRLIEDPSLLFVSTDAWQLDPSRPCEIDLGQLELLRKRLLGTLQ